MQLISKFEQRSLSPLSSPTSSLSSLSSSPISLKNSKDLMENITKLLEKGQESAHQIRTLLNERLRLKAIEDHHDQDHQADLDHHSRVTLNSFETVLSLIKSCDFDQEDFIRKRKIDGLSNNIEECLEEINGGKTVSKEKRGCYKRRKTGQSWTVETTNLVDDGHAWRKYGQKEILNTKYPRNYYRCTHKHDQKCQALKQVQQISENPTKYNIIYHNHHTCKNLHKTPSIIIDCQEEKSSIYVSFDSNNYPTNHKQQPLNSSLFPPSAFLTSPAMVKQEYTSIKVESSSMPQDLDHHHHHHHHAEPSLNLQYSSSCSDNHLPSSSDLTSTGLSPTPVSDQGDNAISSSDFYDDLLNLITVDDDYYDRLDGILF